MKAGNAGNGQPYGTARHRREVVVEDLARPFSSEDQRSFQRELFVYHQQDLAGRALHLGSPGAARAALRALYAVDFADAAEAMHHLRVLRDPAAQPEDVTRALRVLVQLTPLGTR
jgi:hypothetical protein